MSIYGDASTVMFLDFLCHPIHRVMFEALRPTCWLDFRPTQRSGEQGRRVQGTITIYRERYFPPFFCFRFFFFG